MSCGNPNVGCGDSGESGGRPPSNASQYCSQLFPLDGVTERHSAPALVDVTVDEAVVSRVDMDKGDVEDT